MGKPAVIGDRHAGFILASNDAWGLLRDTKDRIEGRVAFGEKRKPKFTGE